MVSATLARPQKPAVLSAIESWPHWDQIVAGTVKEYGISEAEAHRVLPEYQRFMALLASGERRLGMHSAAVDQMWHAHILNTHLYAEFCQAYLGRFVHHVPVCTSAYECETGPDTDPLPVPPQPPKRFDNELPTGARFRLAYIKVFGEAPDAIWNLPVADGVAI